METEDGGKKTNDEVDLNGEGASDTNDGVDNCNITDNVTEEETENLELGHHQEEEKSDGRWNRKLEENRRTRSKRSFDESRGIRARPGEGISDLVVLMRLGVLGRRNNYTTPREK